MKTKIFNALRTKYQRFGLSNEAVDRIASALEKTVTAESEIDEVIAGASTMELIANELQKSADAERRSRSDLQKSFDEYKGKHPSPVEPPKPAPDDDIKALLLEMKKQNDALKARLDANDATARDTQFRTAVRTALESDKKDNKAIMGYIMDTFKYSDSDTEESLIERYKGVYDEKYKMFYGDGVMPAASGVFPQRTGSDEHEFDAAVNRLRESGVLPAKK